MISVEYHDDLKEVQADAALAALLRAPQARAPFDRLEWWNGLVDHCDLFPLVAVARSGSERLVLPLLRRGRQIHCLANWYSFRVAPIFTAGADRPGLLEALARDLAGQAPHLVLTPMPDEAGEATSLVEALRKAGWATFMERCDVNHVLPLAGRNFAEYLANRPSRLRNTLRRKSGRIEIAIQTGFDPATWADYEAVYAQSWKGEEGSPSFLREFARQEGAAGRLRLAIGRADGVPVAAQFWTIEAGTAFIHKLAHLETARDLSAGTLLTAALLARVIDDDRVELVDFGTGDDPYKRDWMEAVRPRYRIEAFRAGWPGNWPRIARKALHRLAGAIRHG